MFSLCIDISSDEGIFALFHDDEVVEEIVIPVRPEGGQLSCQQPVCVWQRLLDRHSLVRDDIAYLVCGIGPGSYTGIRSAAATAKGVAFGSGKLIVAVFSPLFFVPPESGKYLICTDAGISGVYAQHVVVGEEGISLSDPIISRDLGPLFDQEELLLPERFVPPDREHEWARKVKKQSHVAARVSFQEYSCSEFFQGNKNPSWELSGFGARVYSAKTLPVQYLRKTQAEINLEK